MRITRSNSRHNKPKVIAFSGPPYAGKSTLAEALSKELDVPWMDVDQIRLRLLPDSQQTLEDRSLAYRAMHLCAEHLLQVGQDIILVATYRRKSARRELEQVCGRTGAGLYIVECEISPGLAVKRYEEGRKNHPAIDLTKNRVELLAMNFPYSRLGLVIDGSRDTETSLQQIREYLRSGTAIQREWATLLQDEGAE